MAQHHRIGCRRANASRELLIFYFSRNRQNICPRSPSSETLCVVPHRQEAFEKVSRFCRFSLVLNAKSGEPTYKYIFLSLSAYSMCECVRGAAAL
jgi:hypothetical protein